MLYGRQVQEYIDCRFRACDERNSARQQGRGIKEGKEYDKDTMRITILDEGGGFDFRKSSKAKLPDDVMKESGRGLYIVKSLIDEVEFKDTGQGTEIILTMRKKK